jgi:hypothetical protein
MSLALFSAALAREQFAGLPAIPASSKVVIDDDLSDWDLSGATDTYYEESLLPAFRMTFAANAQSGWSLLLGAIRGRDAPDRR